MGKWCIMVLVLVLSMAAATARNVPNEADAGLKDQKNFLSYGGVGAGIGGIGEICHYGAADSVLGGRFN
ncbi:hypothetical protein K1719_006910 [Acacia pycnantha]|nr:hypothetical protein K1719_006910 [Acacia pycnantha]